MLKLFQIDFNFIDCTLSFNCTGQRDGIYEASCQSAVVCKNSQATQLDCAMPSVVNEETLSCDE